MELTILINAGKASIKLAPRFDMTTLSDFRQAYVNALKETGVNVIEVDLAEVQFIDSSALGSLLLLREQAAKSARTITLINCQPQVMKILRNANFHRLFDIH
jgi:HptB-dependent secretion and biofilm anti anti-sigma factor